MSTEQPPLATSNQETAEITPYLKFQVVAGTWAALPLANVREVLSVTSKSVIPVPNMPPCILGLLSHRSRVYWVASLSQVLNLQAAEQITQQYSLIFFQVEQTHLAFVVAEVKGKLDLQPKQIQSLEAVTSPSGLLSYTHGYIQQGDEMVYLLEPHDLGKASVLRT